MSSQGKTSQNSNVLGLLGQGASKPKAGLVFTGKVTKLSTAQLLTSRGRADIKATFHRGPVCVLHSATRLEPNGFTEATSSRCSGDSGMC